MVNQNESSTVSSNDASSASNNSFSTEYLSPRNLQPSPDDVIRSLANAYENERARQVSEWERLRSISVSHALI